MKQKRQANQRNGERGQTLPLIGLTFMVLMGVGAYAIDVGWQEYQQMRMQSATDAAAIAGAQALITHGCPDQPDALTAAKNDANNDNFPVNANTVLTVDNPPNTNDGPYQNNNCAVYVSIKVPQNWDSFLRFWGAPNGMPITTSAVALEQNKNPGCIYLLNPSVKSTMTGATITATSCGILMNDSATASSATIKAKQVGYVGSAPGGTWPNATPTPMEPTEDPCPEIGGCYSITNNPPSQSGCIAYTASSPTVTLTPGCYSSLDVHVATATTFLPGTYVLTGTSNLGTGTLTGTGVTFYLTASATAMNFSGNSGGSLSAPTSTGTYPNVLYYQVPGNSTPPAFGNPTGLTNISGLIYAPGATTATYCCTTGYVVLVFGGATFTSAIANAANAVTIPSATSIVANVVLVQ